MKRVLVAYDGSPQSDEALDHALAEFPDAEIVVLNVIDPAAASYSGDEMSMAGDNWPDAAMERAERVLEEARERAGDRAIEAEHTVGRPGRAIVRYAEENAIDHVVTGSHGRTGVARLLLGSVAETVVRRSPVPVTVVR